MTKSRVECDKNTSIIVGFEAFSFSDYILYIKTIYYVKKACSYLLLKEPLIHLLPNSVCKNEELYIDHQAKQQVK
jgi:hypothetical protein